MPSPFKKIEQKIRFEYNKIRIINNTKYFCIGCNKTGTTSVKKAFKLHGFVIGNQRKAELLMDDYFDENDFPIINYCKTGEFFQDVPFSLPNTFKVIDNAYPNSKFILTVRDNSEQWYNSLVNFHSKLYGNGEVPTVELLKKVDYVYPGWTWNTIKKMYNITEYDNPYSKEMLIAYYEKHNKDVLNYFKDRPNDLLVINVSDKNSYQQLAKFIDVVVGENEDFPWENKT
ncbi:MAG: hypothetical protein J5I47_02370 [Vicingus serpentipes]|nr:hypothetical protein [Vicingus serpentipes]